jgi:leucyl aminopeptidase
VAVDLVELEGGKLRRLYVVGLGRADKADPEAVRQGGGALARIARSHRLKNVAALAPLLRGLRVPEAGALLNGYLLASFQYAEHKGTASMKKDAEAPTGPVRLTIVVGDAAAVRDAVRTAQVLADAQNLARTVAFRPGNQINPPSFAKLAQEMARELKLTSRVLDEKQMAKLGMEGILAVGRASESPPRMIVLEHRPRRPAKHKPLLVVGKGITFDTGGISIKPAERLGRMIFDKCGATTVLGLMYALAKLDAPIPVVGILSCAENTLSGRAYRPGDILRLYNGVTVEVTNTDAEGRLVLGDALAWGIETYKPAAVVNLATLTGGVIVALGKSIAGAMTTSDELFAEIEQAAREAGEKVWRLPLWDEHREAIKSDTADIVNSGGREGHVLQGGAFLSHFVPDDGSIPWMHLDIAGVADTDKDLPYYGKGATGWGLRTLYQWVIQRSA